MKPSRVITLAAVGAAAVSMSIAGPASADSGKSAYGCSNPYIHVTYDLATGELILPDGSPEPNTLAGLTADPPIFSIDGSNGTLNVDALYLSLDHNTNRALCIKVPSGWNEPNNGNGRAGLFVNLVDDYKS